jgi:integrase
MDRNHFNAYVWKTAVWKTALAASGIEPSRANGMHALRHFYVSVLLDAGESIKALSEYLGHSDPGLIAADLHPPAADQRTANKAGRRPPPHGSGATADGLPTAQERD